MTTAMTYDINGNPAEGAAASKIKTGGRVLVVDPDHEDHGCHATALKEFVMRKSGKRKWRIQLEDDTAPFMVRADQLQPALKKSVVAESTKRKYESAAELWAEGRALLAADEDEDELASDEQKSFEQEQQYKYYRPSSPAYSPTEPVSSD